MGMPFRFRSLVVTALALSLAAVGCGTKSDSTIKVGAFLSMTGGTATFGQSSQKGMQLAIDEANAAGGVLGKKLTLITEDDRSNQQEAKTAAVKLLQQDKVVALLGEVASSSSLAAAPDAQRAQVPMISPSSTNPKVTEVGDYIFRVCFIDPFQGGVMAKFAHNTLKATTACDLQGQPLRLLRRAGRVLQEHVHEPRRHRSSPRRPTPRATSTSARS